MNSFFDPDYRRFYDFFKKLPGILTIVMAVLYLIGAILDLSLMQFDGYCGVFYIFLDVYSSFWAFVLWILSAAIDCVATWFLTTLLVSPVVVRTDATLATLSCLRGRSKSILTDIKENSTPKSE